MKNNLPIVEPGDIVLIHRAKYDGPFKYLITRLILFFTTAWWRSEKTSKYYHAEMVNRVKNNGFQVITDEPPGVRFKDRSFDRKRIYRLRNKPSNFIAKFDAYVRYTYKMKYGYFGLLLLFVRWLFLDWNFVGKIWIKPVCSGHVAAFYELKIKIPCSEWVYELTSPDDIEDYCESHSEIFERIFG